MNWLIISSDVKNKDIKIIEDFLFTKDITAEEFFLTQISNRNDFIYAANLISECSYCVILDTDNISDLDRYKFILGMLVGRSVRTFIYSDKKDTEEYEISDKTNGVFISYFNSIKKLCSYIKKEFPVFEAETYQREALTDLYLTGIPFTADAFASYLSKECKDEKETSQNFKLLQQFIVAGMHVDAYTSYGVPLLSVATRNDKLDYVKFLLKNGADINQISNDRGYTAVMDAVWRKNYEITKFLIDKGARLDVVSSDGQPVLVLAVGNGNVKITELLLKNGADPDLADSMGMSARAYANLFKNPELVKLMEKYPKK